MELPEEIVPDFPWHFDEHSLKYDNNFVNHHQVWRMLLDTDGKTRPTLQQIRLS